METARRISMRCGGYFFWPELLNIPSACTECFFRGGGSQAVPVMAATRQ